MSEQLLYLMIGGGFTLLLAGAFVFSAKPATYTKRLKMIAAGERRQRGPDPNAMRRKAIQETVKGLREKESQIRKGRVAGKSIEDRIRQAGLNIPVSTFWIASGVSAVVAAGVAWYVSGYWLLAVLATIVAGLGLPRWVLGALIGARQKKFMMQFADALDIIVRGVKSGLPLTECLRIIARESSEPLKNEFERVCDGLAMGQSIDQALDRLYQRTPIQEVNFFNIVMAIQQKAGGNLSEALGNLATVLRGRKLLREKIKALSAEAKASALIIGSLPIIVMLLVYLTTPDYIMSLFTDPTGHFILLIATVMMGLGIYIMRTMINFDF
ncbi:pilus assembly protein [bacterium]|nr:pilus assembly protein [bacterium]